MTPYPNPVFRGVAVRVVAPFVPVWLFGLVLALTLNQVGLSESGAYGLGLFAATFSVLVAALIAALVLWERRHAPAAIDLDVEHVGPLGASERDLPFGQITAIREGGFFGARVEAGRSAGISGSGLRWIYLTRDNAERLALAIAAWREREAAEPMAVPA